MKMRVNLFILLFFLIVSVFMTWPVALHMKSSVKSSGDPLLNTWILAWNCHKLLTSPGELFEANIFYPHKHTLAYSEHLLASSLLAMPFILIWKSPLLGYNFVFLFSFVFSGFGMYLLVKDLTGKAFPGICAGLSFAFCPYRFGHLTHLHLLTIQWLPLIFLYLHRFIKKEKLRDLILFTVFLLLHIFSGLHLALFALIAIVPAFLFLLRGKKIFLVVVSLFLIAVVFSPVAKIYFDLQKEMGFVRPVDEVKYYSANFKSFLAAPGGNMLYGRITRRFSEPEKELFPGLLVLALAVIGFKGGFKRIKFFYLALGVLSFILAFGPHFPVYRFFYSHLPGFKGVRAPARFSLLIFFSLSVLSGFGACRIISKRKKVAGVLMIPLLVLEYWSAPLSLFRIPRDVPEVYRWLASQDDSVILELPMPESHKSVHNETRYMYWSTFHWKKMVNGYSGFFPDDYWEINRKMQSFPSDESIALLKNLGVTHVIIHARKFRRGDWFPMKEKLSSFSMRSFGAIHVIEIF